MTTQQTIPISSLISATPSVLSPGTGLNQLSGLIITQNTTVVGDQNVIGYANAQAVATAFGATSVEYAMAQSYFAGTTIAFQPPGVLYFAGYGSAETGVTATYLAAVAANAPFNGLTTTWQVTESDGQNIANWVNTQGGRYWYAYWDNNAQAAQETTGTTFGQWLMGTSLNGTSCFCNTPQLAAAALGWMASIDFSIPNGRSNLAYRSNSAQTPTVTYEPYAQNLLANGYSFYGLFGNGTTAFFYNGMVSGAFLWADSYINQMWLNANLQAALVNLLQSIGQVPFNARGDALISAALQNTITQAVSFGAIQAGVALTSEQQMAVNSSAGSNSAATTLSQRGWYLIPGASTASATVRVKRGPITPILYYCDGQSVQTINLASVEVQ